MRAGILLRRFLVAALAAIGTYAAVAVMSGYLFSIAASMRNPDHVQTIRLLISVMLYALPGVVFVLVLSGKLRLGLPSPRGLGVAVVWAAVAYVASLALIFVCAFFYAFMGGRPTSGFEIAFKVGVLLTTVVPVAVLVLGVLGKLPGTARPSSSNPHDVARSDR